MLPSSPFADAGDAAFQLMRHSSQHPVQVLIDERLAENAEAMGQLLRSELQDLASHTDRVKLVRGKGLLNAVVIAERDGVSAWDVCMRLKDNGILVRAQLTPSLDSTYIQFRPCGAATICLLSPPQLRCTT